MYLSFAIFDETTYAAVQFYFPIESSTFGFLNLGNTQWTITNSKTKYSPRNYLGNAAVHGDNKPFFKEPWRNGSKIETIIDV